MQLLRTGMNRTKILITGILMLPWCASAQPPVPPDSVIAEATLTACVQYALGHQPLRRQALLDEEITDRAIGARLADWFPQVTLNFSAQHDFVQPVTFFQGNPIPQGLPNVSSAQFQVTQTLFNRDVLLASSTAGDLREQSRQRTTGTSIDVVTNVSKAFYAALLTRQENDVLDENITRLQQDVNDTRSQYQAGVVDKTDFERATVALNNALVLKRQNEELLKVRFAQLKQQMGYPSDGPLDLKYDTTRMATEILLDTSRTVKVEQRIEYQILLTQKRLQEANLSYQRWGFLPSLSAFGAYSLNYSNSRLADLYRHDYPSSWIGVELSLPIFLGGRRIEEISEARLQVDRADFDLIALRDAIETEYTQALAGYKSNLVNYQTLKSNLELAEDVHRIIQLQYKAGTKTYLDLITSQTDLQTAQVNYVNALYEVLSSKLDVQKALGTVRY